MKRFQVFVSSTFRDLETQRRAVSQNVLELNHIPVGMEFFGATDQQQMDFIKREIDRSDYYLLIVGGKYGTIEPLTGKSYTHLEYEYAATKRLPILVFVQKDRHSLPVDLRETEGARIALLDNLINSAAGDNRIRAEWTDTADLVNKTGNALTKEIIRTSQTAIGWIRSDSITDSSLQAELYSLRDQLQTAKARVRTH